MPGTCCAVHGCHNRGGHQFPVDKERCKAWVVAIRRVGNKTGKLWWPSESSVICRSHFCIDDYEKINFRGFKSRIKKLKKTAVPSRFWWTEEESPAAKARSKRLGSRCAKRLRFEESQHKENLKGGTVEDQEGSLLTKNDDLSIIGIEEITVSSCQSLSSSVGVQTDSSTLTTDCQSQTDSSVPIEVFRTNVEDFSNDPTGIHFYTGLESYELFCSALSSLGPAAYRLSYLYSTPSLSIKDQMFLTLIKLRTYKTNFELSRMFHIAESEVYNIFVTWIRFMSLQWREIDIWPSKETVSFHAPSDFGRKFPKTRCVFDATECPIKKPKAPAAQQVTFSSYKNRNTAKVLIGVTPGGQVSYVSDVYGGAASDRQIVERANITSMCAPGDSLMADKGFDVQDIFAPLDVSINIPTFFKKRNRMCGKTVIKDRAISSKRVHVERVIGLGKTYKILCHPLNHSETILSTDIIFICYMLVNFRRCIVPREA